METLHPAAAALLQRDRGDSGGGDQQRRLLRVPLGQLDRAGSASNVLSSPGGDARKARKVRIGGS